jgi:hypothetical protein
MSLLLGSQFPLLRHYFRLFRLVSATILRAISAPVGPRPLPLAFP